MAGALEIYKLLPKTNCGECGLPTCLAFAMRLVSKNVVITECPYIVDEARSKLENASILPIKKVTINFNENKLVLGGEDVFYRHEKTFNNQTAISIKVSDLDQLNQQIVKIKEYKISRLAENLTTELISIFNDSKEKENFLQTVKLVQAKLSKPVILHSVEPVNIDYVLTELNLKEVIIGSLNEDNKAEMLEIAKKHNSTLIVSSNKNLTSLISLADEAKEEGIENILLDCTAETPFETIRNQINLRWKAVREKDYKYGFPIISFPFRYFDGEPLKETITACLSIIKYSSLVVLNTSSMNHIVPLLILRQNIFTNPQKPIQVDPKLYSIGEVNENSPVFITTNFSLTYFTVSSDIESINIPSYLLVVDTEGTSVLTAFAGDKINEDKIAKAIEDSKLDDLVNHKKIIIPGYLSPLSSKITDKSGWDVLVGPMDSSDIISFINSVWRDKID